MYTEWTIQDFRYQAIKFIFFSILISSRIWVGVGRVGLFIPGLYKNFARVDITQSILVNPEFPTNMHANIQVLFIYGNFLL